MLLAVLLSGAVEPPSQDPNAAPAAPKHETGSARIPVPNPITEDMPSSVRSYLQVMRETVLTHRDSAASWDAFGVACDAHGLHECAETCYRRAIALSPKHFFHVYHLAVLLDRTRPGSDECVASFQAAIRLRPGYIPGLWRLGSALQRKGRNDEALEFFERSVQIAPDFSLGYRGIGQILLAKGDIAQAIDQLKRAAQLEPKDGAVFAALSQAYERAGDVERAKRFAEESRGLEPVYSVEDPIADSVRAKARGSATALTRAKGNVGAGNFEAAIPDLLLCAKATPDDPIVHAFLATCFRATDDLQQAEKHGKKALQLDESLVSAHLELSAVYIKSGDLSKGYAHYQTAQDLEPENGKIDAWIADMLVQRGYLRPAISAFARAKSLGALDADAHWKWGVALAEQGDLDGAIRHFNESLHYDSEFVNSYYSLGFAFEQQGRREEAIEQYRTAARIDPKHAAAARLKELEAQQP